MKRMISIGLFFSVFALWISINYTWKTSEILNFNPIKKHLIIGTIQSIPVYDNHHLTFSLKLKQIDSIKNINGHVRLDWYGHSPYLQEGEEWQLIAKLKKAQDVRQYKNFNYSKWLLVNNFQAVGYVQPNVCNRLVKKEPKSFWHYQIYRLRKKISFSIKKSLENSKYINQAGLLSALIVGIRSNISSMQWMAFRKTGTSYLIVISGLHIGLCAVFAFFIMRLLWSSSVNLILLLPAQKAGYLAAWVIALIYSLLAGFALPTQRAFIMISCFTLAKLINRSISLMRALSLAFFLILAWEPLAILSASFWLSFVAVAIIAYGIQGRVNPKFNIWWRFGRIQFVITLGLYPLTLWFFQEASFSSLFANFAAFPIVAFIILPLCLMGCIFLLFYKALAYLLFKIAAIMLYYLVAFLHRIAILPYLFWHYRLSNRLNFIELIFTAILVLAPRGLPIRWLGIIMFLQFVLIKL